MAADKGIGKETIAWPYLCFSASILLLLIMFDYTSELTSVAGSAFLASTFVLWSMVLVAATGGVLMVLAFLGVKRLGARGAFLGTAFCLLGSLPLFMLGSTGSLDTTNSGLMGAVFGIGMTLLLLVWGDLFGHLDMLGSFFHFALSLGIAATVEWIVVVFGGTHPSVLLVTIIISLCVSLTGTMFLARSCPTMRDDDTTPATYTCDAEQIRASFSDLWRPLLGFGLVLMLIGSSWGRAYGSGSVLDPSSYVLFERPFFVAVTSFLLIPLTRRVMRKHSLNTFFQITVPIISAILLISWIMQPIEQSTFSMTFMGFARGVAIAGLATGVWMYVSAAVFEEHIAPNVLFAGGIALLACFVLLNFWSDATLDQQVASNINPVCTIVYLLLICTSMTLQSTRPQPALFSPGISDICQEIGQRYSLSPRETEILIYIAKGRTSTFIADALCLSPHTVKTHVKHIHEKLGVSSSQEIIDMVEADSHQAALRAQ